MTNQITMSTAATLRTSGAPSFVVSTGMSTWSGAAPAHRGNGFGIGYGIDAATPKLRLTVDIPNPTVVRTRVAAKQDRPPREALR